MVNFIHIGYPKTGTTFIQESLLNHPEISLLGYGNFLFFKELILRVNFENDLIYNNKEVKYLVEKEISKIKKLRQLTIVGISRESLCGGYSGLTSKLIADRLYELFGPTKIIITIRNQLDMIDSMHSQFVKKGYALRIKQFIKDNIILISSIYEYLQYHHLIDYYVNRFGRENVLILTYEELKSEKEQFFLKLYSFIGCSPHDYLKSQYSDKKMFNPQLYSVTRCIMSFFNYLGFNPIKTRKIFEKYGIKERRKSNSWMIDFIEPRVINDFKKSNRLLEERYHLLLGDKGYLM